MHAGRSMPALPSAASGTALCVTGLERSFPEIGRNIRHVVNSLNHSEFGPVHAFGVQPVNQSWSAQVHLLLPMTRVAQQKPCHARAEEGGLQWFTCTRGGKTTRGGKCADAFVQSLCDLQQCDALLRTFEVQRGRPFRLVGRLRLDIAFEGSIALPSANDTSFSDMENTVLVPHMNSQGGLNDKFALGGRAAMAQYLNRVSLVDLNFSTISRDAKNAPTRWKAMEDGRLIPAALSSRSPNCTKRVGCMLSMNSERFLSFALWKGNVSVVRRQDWMFCKFGDDSHAWPECTRRMRERTVCTSLICISWGGRGCQCLNSTCTQVKGKQAWCTDMIRR